MEYIWQRDDALVPRPRPCHTPQATSSPPSRSPPAGSPSHTRPSPLSPFLLPLPSAVVSITRRSSRMGSLAIRRSGSPVFLQRTFARVLSPVFFLTAIAPGQHWRLVPRKELLPDFHRLDFWSSFCSRLSPVLSATPSQQVFMALCPSHRRRR